MLDLKSALEFVFLFDGQVALCLDIPGGPWWLLWDQGALTAHREERADSCSAPGDLPRMGCV